MKQEARSSVVGGATRAAPPPSTAMLEEEGTESSIQRTASLPLMGTSFPARVERVPIFVFEAKTLVRAGVKGSERLRHSRRPEQRDLALKVKI